MSCPELAVRGRVAGAQLGGRATTVPGGYLMVGVGVPPVEDHGLVLGGLAAVVAVEDVLPGLAQVLQRRLLVEPAG